MALLGGLTNFHPLNATSGVQVYSQLYQNVEICFLDGLQYTLSPTDACLDEDYDNFLLNKVLSSLKTPSLQFLTIEIIYLIGKRNYYHYN